MWANVSTVQKARVHKFRGRFSQNQFDSVVGQQPFRIGDLLNLKNGTEIGESETY